MKVILASLVAMCLAVTPAFAAKQAAVSTQADAGSNTGVTVDSGVTSPASTNQVYSADELLACTVVLCLASPGGPMAQAACVAPYQAWLKKPTKPRCPGVNGSGTTTPPSNTPSQPQRPTTDSRQEQ